MRLSSPWSLLALSSIARGSTLPYNPTRIFSATNSSNLYILGPSAQAPNQGVLQAVSLSGTISTAEGLSTATISNSLPFLNEDTLQPYTPVMDETGNITVVAGGCNEDASKVQVWRFTPDDKSDDGSGSWTQNQTTFQSSDSESGISASNFLSSGIAFSPDVDVTANNTQFYIFGGMCPFNNSTADTWMGDAQYSDNVLSISPNGGKYDVNIASIEGGPIAESGFSVTGLTPSISSNGEGGQQQQDFLLIGGNTQTAFINLSQIALYSLPQESWNFLPVNQPTTSKTELAARQSSTSIEPRSGHTALLSSDGSKVVVFGGWVGNVANPAQPQLALISLGSGYGGDGAGQPWSWSIPTQSGSGLAAGSGIYGHGAIMLPGDIMMVSGGYSILAATEDSKRSKRAAPSANTQLYLYNTSSNTWISSYAASNVAGETKDTSNSGLLSKPSQLTGLGVGVGVGVVVIVALILFYFWYTGRRKGLRRDRERTLLTRSSDGSLGPIDQSFLSNTAGFDGRGGNSLAMGGNPYQRDRAPSGGYNSAPQMEKAGSTGLFVDVPSPTRGLRKGLSSRPYMYHAAPRYDERRFSRGSGNIPPIFEQEGEDEYDATSPSGDIVDQLKAERRRRMGDQEPGVEPEEKLRQIERVLNSSPVSNPFRDPDPNPLGSHPVLSDSEDIGAGDTVRRVPTQISRDGSPSRQRLRANPEAMKNWTIVNDEHDVPDLNTGRVSPTKSDDRTSSTLSERSQRSQASTTSITRTMSTRTGALLAAAFGARKLTDTAESSSGEERTSTMSSGGSRNAPYSPSARPLSLVSDSPFPAPLLSADKSSESFLTARSNVIPLQNESHALLGGGLNVDRDDPYQRAKAAQASTGAAGQPDGLTQDKSPQIPSRRRSGWVGSLRRALTAISVSERTSSLTTAIMPYEDEPQTSAMSSPTKQRAKLVNFGDSIATSSAPRRAVSDGGSFLRQKRGRKDWTDQAWTPYHDDPDPGDWGEPRSSMDQRQAEEEWDVEGEASNRDVQILTFTVPKSRLRVVNVNDQDRASIRSASDGALSRSGSLTQPQREDSVRRSKPRTDDDRERIPLSSTTEEESEDGHVSSDRNERLLLPDILTIGGGNSRST